jgi:hypothetical protein
MTPARQPQQEYIITEDDLETIWDMLCSSTTMEEIYDRIQSRPNTSAPALDYVQEMEDMRKELEVLRTEHYNRLIKEMHQTPEREPCRECDFGEREKHDAQVAKAEREQVLLLLIERIEGKKIEKWGESERESIFRSIESLRAQQEPQREGRR